jgi:signal transduction histidine kinase
LVPASSDHEALAAEQLASLLATSGAADGQLEEAVARAEHLEAVARVAATAAHDFGNVLLAVSIFQGFIAEGLGPDHVLAPDVAAIGEAVERGRAMHAQLVAVGRDAPDDWDAQVNALDVLGRLSGILQAIAAPATLRLGADPGEDPGMPPMVRMGQRSLEHAVLSLVVNARDAMTSRAGVITVTVGAALPAAGSDVALPAARYVTVVVADDGPGMPRGVLDRAMEPFYTTKANGSGLGLPSVLRTARRAGGAVRIDSTLGAGTTVTLLLPEAPAE